MVNRSGARPLRRGAHRAAGGALDAGEAVGGGGRRLGHPPRVWRPAAPPRERQLAAGGVWTPGLRVHAALRHPGLLLLGAVRRQRHGACGAVGGGAAGPGRAGHGHRAVAHAACRRAGRLQPAPHSTGGRAAAPALPEGAPCQHVLVLRHAHRDRQAAHGAEAAADDAGERGRVQHGHRVLRHPGRGAAGDGGRDAADGRVRAVVHRGRHPLQRLHL
mmetsp:Transcript_46244/g.117065  ORF Transcript_46244/g.117065 Transcript_46244/m.117065 type:complete len:217 (+) Transcript_46244:805-1455(+)